jgi:hypothetical protein
MYTFQRPIFTVYHLLRHINDFGVHATVKSVVLQAVAATVCISEGLRQSAYSLLTHMLPS